MDPEDRAPTRPGNTLKAVWGVIEPLLALAAASLLTLGLSLAFIPMELQVEVALRPAEGGFLLWTPDDLARRVRDLGVSAEVRLVKDGPEPMLRLLGVTDLGAVTRQVREFLVVGGYEQPWFRTSPQLDVGELVRNDPGLLPKFLSVQAVVFLVFGLILAWLRVDAKIFAPRSRPLRAVLLGLGGGIAAILLSVVMGLLLKLLGWPVHEQAWLEELLGEPAVIWRLAPWIVVVVPIAEEVFFRAYMLRFMAQRMGFIGGMILSSAVFATIHLNPSGFPVYIVIAGVMAWVYRRSGSLASPILAHMTLNGTVLLAGSLVP